MRSAVLTLVVAPLLLAGCSSSSSSSSEGGGEAQSTGRPGRNWILFDQGTVSGAPSASYGKASPTPSITLPTLPPASGSPKPTPSPTCTPQQHIKTIDGLGVRPSSTSAVVTWYNPGGSDLVDYRITAASQVLVKGMQPELGWTRSMPAKCGFVSATVTGLTPGTPYIFTVDKVRTRENLGLDGVQTQTIGRSHVVTTTSG
ncbi:fibronectin type III domain-containing protein [Actinoplanes sp. G11-F43]|uniref:fibronectin type III domain-containing protein n=1 Tax=Actinoplanes sp. G11-F43 TaxID=3424130 RepID=UPI003D33FA62